MGMSVKVVSLFSGGGGMDIGFKRAGYEVIWAVDNDKNAVATYRRNVGEHIVLGDLSRLDLDLIPRGDVLIGGPPCQSFSLLGKRDASDGRNELIWRYLEVLERMKPQAFMMENVPGLKTAQGRAEERLLPQLLREFERLGYKTACEVLDFAEYGLPQRRKRLIMVGLKDGVFSFPPPTHGPKGIRELMTVEEAFWGLPKPGGRATFDHEVPKMSELDEIIARSVRPGGNYQDIPGEMASSRVRDLQKYGQRTTSYGRLRGDRPAMTINTYFNRPNAGTNIHHAEDRLITVREALRLQGFSDDYELVSSSKRGKNKIVGNAVSPLVAEVLARELLGYVRESRATASEPKEWVAQWLAGNEKLVLAGESLSLARGQGGSAGGSNRIFVKPERAGRTGKKWKAAMRTAAWVKVAVREGDSRCLGLSTRGMLTAADAVLLPRSVRVWGKVFLTDRPTLVSTNFVILSGGRGEAYGLGGAAGSAARRAEAEILASWMSTVFAQVNLEAVCKEQEGIRKVEKSGVAGVFVPDLGLLSREERRRLREDFVGLQWLELNRPKVRATDLLWAKILYGESARARLWGAVECLQQAAERRNPTGMVAGLE